jgi:glycosyltransferase involved in cell wall biosynthesis
MRILHSVHNFLPQQVAGVEVYTSRLLAGQRHKDAVGLVTARLDSTRRTGDLAETQWEGVPVYEVVQNRDGSSFSQTWLDERLEASFRSSFDRFEPDILHVQHLMNLTLSLVSVAREMNVPIVMTLHDHWWSCANGGQRFHPDRTCCDRLEAKTCGRCTWASVGPLNVIRSATRRRREKNIREASSGEASDGASKSGASTIRPIRGVLARHWPTPFGARRIEHRWNAMRNLAKDVELFVVPSRDLADAAIEFGFPIQKVRVLAHGMPLVEKRVPRTNPTLAAHFGYLGSLVPHKGVHHLVAAFRGMPLSATLSIHGSLNADPGYVRELRAIASHPGIRFLDEMAPNSVPDMLANLDCLVAPSIWRENAPLGVQEAFVAGTPVVATNLGGHTELLETGGGLLVPPGDEVALLAAMRRLATEPGLASRLATSAPTLRSIEAHISDLREIYESVLAPDRSS